MTRKTITTPTAPVKSPDEQAVERLPLFGPGLVIRVPLHLWPMYQQVHNLDVLPPQLPAHERINQQVVYVKRVAPVQPRPTATIRWCCLSCEGHPELFQPEMMEHMRTVHAIDVPNCTGTKTLTMKLDAEGVYQSAWEYVIDGLKFIKYEPVQKEEAK